VGFSFAQLKQLVLWDWVASTASVRSKDNPILIASLYFLVFIRALSNILTFFQRASLPKRLAFFCVQLMDPLLNIGSYNSGQFSLGSIQLGLLILYSHGTHIPDFYLRIPILIALFQYC